MRRLQGVTRLSLERDGRERDTHDEAATTSVGKQQVGTTNTESLSEGKRSVSVHASFLVLYVIHLNKQKEGEEERLCQHSPTKRDTHLHALMHSQ